MFKWQKKRKDRKALAGYKRSLEIERKVYVQEFSAISEGGRKNRALTIGECCLRGMEKINDLVNMKPKGTFVPGTLMWQLYEHKVKDEDGAEGYKYGVIYRIQSYERAWTDEEVKAKVRAAAEKIHAETEEMFAEDEEDEEQEKE